MSTEFDWVVQWFTQRNSLGREEIAKNSQNNYIEMGYIDSFAMIELISQAENEFSILFDETHFQDRRFSSIHGISQIIKELRENFVD